MPKSGAGCRIIKARALNVGTGSGGYEERQENDNSSKMLVIFTFAH